MRHDDELGHVYWIGGGSGAGKSTIARRLAARHGLRHHDTDDTMREHAERVDPKAAPYLREFLGMSMDERWLDRGPERMLETFHWFRGEAFELIVTDLLRMPAEPTIVEGFRLLPRLVRPLLSRPERAVWLLPTPRFRAAAFDSRDGMWNIVGRTADPPQAMRNLLTRDAMFTERLRTETRALALHTIDVDTTMTPTDLETRVAQRFGLG